MTPPLDARYVQLLLEPLGECARYRPAFGKNEAEGIDLAAFSTLYGMDPLYRWVGLDAPTMYAAHKAAGGMTSIYRQLGIGCERLLRTILRDTLVLTDEQLAWSYRYDSGNGRQAVHTLDARVAVEDIDEPGARQRMLAWVEQSAMRLGVSETRARSLKGAIFEIRQGYKSADSKRQAADLRFGVRAYNDADMLPVVAIVSTQASDLVCRRYESSELLVLRGHRRGPTSTFAFFEDVVGYDLAGFFERNTAQLRAVVGATIGQLLTP